MTYEFLRCYFTGDTFLYRIRRGESTLIYRDRCHRTALRVLADLRKAAR